MPLTVNFGDNKLLLHQRPFYMVIYDGIAFDSCRRDRRFLEKLKEMNNAPEDDIFGEGAE